jgi:hypothetical protein
VHHVAAEKVTDIPSFGARSEERPAGQRSVTVPVAPVHLYVDPDGATLCGITVADLEWQRLRQHPVAAVPRERMCEVCAAHTSS